MLTGIAKLAAQSPLLEAKREVHYFELPARSLLNRVRAGMPFHWAINPYRGCEFGCKYCYARYTHEFMELRDSEAFENQIFSKAGAAALLRRELGKVEPGESIAIGTATDPYQPAERRFGVTRAILEVFTRRLGYRLSITTKSDLVARDAGMLREISCGNVLHVNVTITTLDAGLARLMEPRAPRPGLRLAAVERLAASGVSVGVYANPVMPLLTDREESLEALAAAAKQAGATHFGAGILFLMPSAQKAFFPFLEEKFPLLVRRYRERFENNPYLRGAYQEMVRDRVRKVRRRHGLSASPIEYQPQIPAPWDAQLPLFGEPRRGS